MNTELKILNDISGQQFVSARELHEKLKINSNFTTWFNRMCEYGFASEIDFFPKKEESTGGRPLTDYDISIDMAKQICMIQRTPEGKAVRQYLIDLEKAWNTPELVMARGLKASQLLLEQKDQIIQEQVRRIEEMRPKEIFTDAVTASDSSILIRDLAKLLKQNGMDIGEKRLYKKLRETGYICKHSTAPTQKAMQMGLFEIQISTVQRADLNPIETRTTKVTGKGQVYFVNKLLKDNNPSMEEIEKRFNND